MGYTKGTWTREGNTITKFGQGVIATCPSPNIGGVFDFVANSYLIAASPNMYEELELYISHQEGKRGHYCSICHNAIQQALAKAEGKIR